MKFRDNARAWALSYEATLTTLDCARFYLIECILCEMLNDVLFLDGCAYKKCNFQFLIIALLPFYLIYLTRMVVFSRPAARSIPTVRNLYIITIFMFVRSRDDGLLVILFWWNILINEVFERAPSKVRTVSNPIISTYLSMCPKI